jgi:hypothetical protein
MYQYSVYNTEETTYLEDTNKIFNDDPVVIVELVLSQFQSFVGRDLVNSLPVCEHKTHHVIGRVPSGYNVTGDEPLLEVEFQAGVAPCREGNCG